MCTWWYGLQSSNRRTDINLVPILRILPQSGTDVWKNLRVGGPNGILVLLIGLALYRNACNKGSVSQKWNYLYLLDDVKWAFEHMNSVAF